MLGIVLLLLFSALVLMSVVVYAGGGEGPGGWGGGQCWPRAPQLTAQWPCPEEIRNSTLRVQ